MILLVGTNEDPTTTGFIKFLTEFSTEFVFLNQENLLYDSDILFNSLKINGQNYSYNSFSGVLNRMSTPNLRYIKGINHRYFQGVSCLFSALSYKLNNVFNYAHLGITNESKLLQLSLLKLKTILKPKHIVLCNKEVENSLAESAFNKVIVKSLSSVRSKVLEYSSNKKKYFKDISIEPILLQELIDGDNVRVHVIVDECFAIKILSRTIDYRYGKGIKFIKHQLPQMVYEECLSVSRQLNLKFCGIDLINIGNMYYILEVNPSPGWSYFENKISLEISTKLRQVLKAG